MSNCFLATYIHHLDPFAIQFTESFGLRWYGLAYVSGFVVAFFLLRWFVKLKASELRESEVADFVTIISLFGIMLGGRLGYMVFYNFDELVANPASFFDVLGGGMSSHGGILGTVLVALIYARFKKKSWTGLGDNLVIVCSLGVFFGRIANFVNGELYGRKTDSSLAMKFPSEITEGSRNAEGYFSWDFPTAQLVEVASKAQDVAPGLLDEVNDTIAKTTASGFDPHYPVSQLILKASEENENFRLILGEILTPRHPSQLYEALIEGLLLFLILLAIRLKWKNLYHGVITGIFFILYAIGRISVENYREPDAGLIAGMTRGQFYSTFMIVIGLGFLIFGFVRKRRNQIPAQA